MKDRIETIILYHLIKDDEYTRKVLPFIEEEYFSIPFEKLIFLKIKEFINKYNSLPTVEAIVIALDKDSTIAEGDIKDAKEYISDQLIPECEKPDAKWLLDETEKWCKKRAVYIALTRSIAIANGTPDKNDRGAADSAIPDIMQKALGVAFSSNIGHDYIADADKRYEFYHTVEEKLEFDIDLMNKITDGGVKKKSLFVLVAGTNAGKSLSMSHMAASFINQGKNVLYVTLEMSEEQIAKRIDANLLNVNMTELEKLAKPIYEQKIAKMKNKASGKLIIQEYPTASAHVGHFRHLLHELNLKKNFKPDVIVLDYLNIAASSRIKSGSNANSYTLVKSIAEEVRGLAMEFNVPIITASQLNRGGQNNSDADFEDVSESHGLAMTCDYMLAMITNEELDKLNQVMFKQIKNRYGDKAKFRRFVVGIDRDKMRLYDVEQSAQQDVANEAEDKSAFDKTKFGSSMETRGDFSKLKFDDDDKF